MSRPEISKEGRRNSLPQAGALGRRLLRDAAPGDAMQAALKARLCAYEEEGFLGPGDEAGWASCVLALTAICSGHYGVGALIVDGAGRVWAHGHNEVCAPHFRSDAHAEMVVLSDFETRYPNARKSGLSLYTSLEPCPMCYTRILISGLPSVFYVAADDPGGMARRRHLMPDYWRAMEGRCAFAPAQSREPLRALARDILYSNMESLEHSVKLVPLALPP